MARLSIFLFSALILVASIQLSAAEEKDNLSTGDYQVLNRADVLLITSDELRDSWNDFAVWKTKTGKPTKIITTTEIDENFPGDDLQAKIRACCLQHIEKQQTEWVILGGDSRGKKGGHVPDRDTHHEEFYKYKNLPTDIYYISKGNWDANDDGIYGQFSEDLDAVDYTHPDASIGRIPVRSVEDVAAYTQKVIKYETEYPEDNFATSMIYTCAETHANPKLNSSKDSLEETWPNGKIQQFFVDKTPWDEEEDGDYDLSTENWTTMINENQAGKMHIHGHGLKDRWVLEKRSYVMADTVDELKNSSAYPVMTTVSCFTGQFDSFSDPCITESMIRKEDGGAIAIIAPSREGIPVFHEASDMKLMMTEGKMDGTTETLTLFWQHAIKDGLTLGHAFREAKQEMTTHARKTDGYHFVQCELNLLGDPTLDIRAESVSNIDATAKLKGGKLLVTGVKDCTVCVWSGDSYEIKQADSLDKLEFQVPENPESVRISASAPSRNTWSTEFVTR